MITNLSLKLHIHSIFTHPSPPRDHDASLQPHTVRNKFASHPASSQISPLSSAFSSIRQPWHPPPQASPPPNSPPSTVMATSSSPTPSPPIQSLPSSSKPTVFLKTSP